MISSRFTEFEQYIADLFTKCDYRIEKNVPLSTQGNDGDIDIVAQKKNRTYCIEVKLSSPTMQAAHKICKIAQQKDMIPVLISFSLIEQSRRAALNIGSSLYILDISNLLYIVQDHPDLTNTLYALLPYDVSHITPQKPEFDLLQLSELSAVSEAEISTSLINHLKTCSSGRKSCYSYETACTEALKFALSEDLTLWKNQCQSNKDLYRFDLLCRIKDGNQHSFWAIVERYFNSKYIVFEFKNYSNKLSQKEIYTTEKYLYSKALRGVAIIISAKGYDENAYWATKGCLRESGKLILLLDTNELINMVTRKNNQEHPADILLDKLDNLLVELEK